ncbi:MAG: hypothetical protein ACP5N1_05845 [Candidatus Woesearchaeota archaeon]
MTTFPIINYFKKILERPLAKKSNSHNTDYTSIKNPDLEKLLNEEEKLIEASKDIINNKDFIFQKYSGTPVTFNIYVGENYRDFDNNLNAKKIIEGIIEEYLKLEYSGDANESTRDHSRNRIYELLKKEQLGFGWDPTNWRLAITPFKEDENSDKISGVSIKLHHNRNNYPLKNPLFGDYDSEYQLNYRTAINKIELLLVKNNIKYD